MKHILIGALIIIVGFAAALKFLAIAVDDMATAFERLNAAETATQEQALASYREIARQGEIDMKNMEKLGREMRALAPPVAVMPPAKHDDPTIELLRQLQRQPFNATR